MAGRAVARLSGRAPAALGLEVGGFRLDFKPDRDGIISVLKRRYGAFSCAPGGGEEFSLSSAPGAQNPFKPAVAVRGGRVEIWRGDFRLAAGLAGGPAELLAAPTEQCLDAALRSLLSFRLLRGGGFMLHSAGLVKRGRAYLFLGKSGAGKSTLSKLAAAAGGEVVSDEINLLGPARGGFRAFGSPFWGEMRADGRPGSWPLGGVYLLKKARRNRVSPCGKAEALKLLLRCAVNFDRSPGVSAQVLGNAAELLAAAPFRRLEFSKADASFLELIGK